MINYQLSERSDTTPLRMSDRTINEEESEEISMRSAAQEFIGCVDSGVGDRSLRKQGTQNGI